MHFQSCAHTQERNGRVLKLLPSADLESLYQQEVKVKGALSTAWLGVEGVLQHTSRALLQRL